MAKIIKDRKIIEDTFQLLSVDDVLPESHIIVPFVRWQREREVIIKHGFMTGIAINGDHNLALLANDFEHIDLIAIEFALYKDGRGYSQARLLRERYGFNKEIRAIGDIMRDQLFYMERCGINAFDLRSDKNPEDALKAFNEFSIRYQAAADAAATPIL